MSRRDHMLVFTSRLEQLTAVSAIRGGLVSLIPVLIIGAFSLILQTFPIAAYQRFLSSFANGLLLDFLQMVYSATFGVLSVHMTFSISHAYMKLQKNALAPVSGAVVSSLISFFILTGVYLPQFGTDSTGPKSMSLAIIAGLGATSLYLRLYETLNRSKRSTLLSSGADRDFNRMLTTLSPIALVSLLFAAVNLVIVHSLDVDSFREWLARIFDWIFSYAPEGFLKGFLFVFFSSVLWFFGIHGSDTLEGVMQSYFTPRLLDNQLAAAAGGQPTYILTKEFFDCFVLMGGCGATITLLLAILLFSKNLARRDLAFTSAFPMLFNINELMVFGLPIIFNPIMFVPFLTVPLVCYSIAYFALSSGLVPLITNSVEWTTPIILGGYSATGSVAGAVLQVVNVFAGLLIYRPFVRILDERSRETYRVRYKAFLEFFQEKEADWNFVRLIDMGNAHGEFARDLLAEFRHSMKENLYLAYQPQYNYKNQCIGAEVLMRWKHPELGYIYPPLIVKLAEEGSLLPELEEVILARALEDYPRVQKKFGAGIKLSVNVTGATVVTPRYLQFVTRLNEKYNFAASNICIEVTEQSALAFSQENLVKLRAFKSLGLHLAIDDFSMGQTSLNYLKYDLFDLLKLDGSLVKCLLSNQNNREIIKSVTKLASSLGMSVLAEFVETEEEKEALHQVGCDAYQGYLFSPAVFLDNE